MKTAKALWLVSSLFGLIACSAAQVMAASDKSVPAQELETKSALDAQIELARTAADNGGFAVLARPFGPLHMTAGDASGAADLDWANSVQNFAFGATGAAAGVDPAKLANDFHCGPPCAERRKAELLNGLPYLRTAVDLFSKANYRVVAIWPKALRVDDRVYGGPYHFERSAILGLAVGHLGGPPEGSAPSEAIAIRGELETTAASSIVRDEFGGVRLIHKESIGDNEAGLLFATDTQAASVHDRQLPNGGRYQGLQRVAPGIYFYMRS